MFSTGTARRRALDPARRKVPFIGCIENSSRSQGCTLELLGGGGGEGGAGGPRRLSSSGGASYSISSAAAPRCHPPEAPGSRLCQNLKQSYAATGMELTAKFAPVKSSRSRPNFPAVCQTPNVTVARRVEKRDSTQPRGQTHGLCAQGGRTSFSGIFLPKNQSHRREIVLTM